MSNKPQPPIMKNIADIYPLSATQKGLLFHKLYALRDESSHTASRLPSDYFEQLIFRISGQFEAEIFRRGGQKVLDTHDVLRAHFMWEGLDQPLQIIRKEVTFPWKLVDNTEVCPSQRQSVLDAYLAEDRARGFDIKKDVLIRGALLQWSQDEFHFVLSFDHLIMDGWSLSIVLRDWMHHYTQLLNSDSPVNRIPDIPPRPFKDFVAWQQKSVDETAIQYWQTLLDSYTPSPLLLPPTEGDSTDDRDDEPPCIKLTENSHKYDLVIGKTETEALRQFCRAQRVTINSLVQFSWGIILSQYYPDRPALFGATVSGRPSEFEGFETMVGLFINTLPVLVDLSTDGDLPIVEWLKRHQETQQTHENDYNLPLATIQHVSPLKAGENLFESLLVFENYPLDPSLMRQKDFSISEVRSIEITGYPLTIIAHADETLTFEFIFNRANVCARQVFSLALRFQETLSRLVRHGEQPLAELDTRSTYDAERLARWHQGTLLTQNPAHTDVLELFYSVVDRQPGARALTDGTQDYTYQQLDTAANKLASFLQHQHLASDPDKDHDPSHLTAPVGILLDRHLDTIIALLAVLKMGRPYLPLDSRYPSERLRYMLKDSRCDTVLTKTRFEHLLEHEDSADVDSSVQVLCLDREQAAIDAGPNTPPKPPVQGRQQDGPVYIIYTSGSTGTPKGIPIKHSSVVNLIYWTQSQYTAQDLAGVLGSTSINFDISVFEIFGTLCSGGTLLFVENILSLGQLGEAYPITLINSVPSLVAELLDATDIPSSVRVINLAGEPLHRELVNRLYDQEHIERVYNLYGPSETTVYSSYSLVSKNASAKPLYPSKPMIGRPLANTSLKVLNEQLKEVPIGITGELYISGTGLTAGYLHQEALNKASFVDLYDDQYQRQTFFKTGDLVRWREHGELEYLGRADHQIKLRGLRIEAGEIEHHLTSFADIHDAVVLLHQETSSTPFLVAYYTRAASPQTVTGTPLNQGDIIEHLNKTLPTSMVPQHYIELEKFPLTQSGKIDRKALPAPQQIHLATNTETKTDRGRYRGINNPIDDLLHQLWCDLLATDNIKDHDNFFDLGGHSLLAMRIASKISQTLQVELSVNNLFEYPTIETLSKHLQSQLNGTTTGRVKLLDIPAPAHLKVYPLSPAQKRLYFLHQLDVDHANYNMAYAWEIRGPLNKIALHTSVQQILATHQILNSQVTRMEGDEPGYNILGDETFTIEHLSVADHHESTPLDEQIKSLTERRFELERERPFRISLICLSESHLLVLVVHHIVADAVSGDIFIAELNRRYQEQITTSERDDQTALQAVPYQYGDYAIWQQSNLDHGVYTSQLDYWRTQLDAITPSMLITDYQRPAMKQYRGEELFLELPISLNRRIEQLCRTYAITPFVFLFTGFALLINKYSGEADISIGVPLSGRQQEPWQDVIGLFVNTVVIRHKFDEDETLLAGLSAIRQTVLDAFSHGDVPFDQVVEALQPAPDTSKTPLFQLMFSYHEASEQALELSGLTVKPYPLANSVAKFDLTLNLHHAEDKTLCAWEYDTALFSHDSMQHMVNNFARLLWSMTESIKQPMAQIGFSSMAMPLSATPSGPEHQQTQPIIGQPASIIDDFMRHVDRYPDKTALQCRDRRLSYRELDQYTSSVCAYLHQRGLGSGSVIGVLTERSLQTVVGLLTVFKLGAVYVPIDNHLPAERIDYILHDAQVDHLLVYGAIPVINTAIPRLNLADFFPGSGPEHGLDFTAPENPDAAYIIYTSGSTGYPKGVFVKANKLHRHMAAILDAFGLTQEDRVYQFAGSSFDVSLEQTFSALLSGATLIIRDEDILSAEDFLRFIVDTQLTVVNLPTAYWHQVYASLIDQYETLDTSALRLLVIGGEAISAHSVRCWAATPWRSVALLNAYGPTEAIITAALHPIEMGPRYQRLSRIPIGRPITGKNCYVLDRGRLEVPIGVPGELYISGLIAEGYVNNTPQTRENFINNPFAPHADTPANSPEKWYKTGDWVRKNTAGELEYLGRLDRQVKYQGFRIELDEIQAILQACPGVQDATVTLLRNHQQSEELVAFLVGPSEQDVEQIMAAAKAKLPAYMIPSDFRLVAKIPHNTNGKIDFLALQQQPYTSMNKNRAHPRRRPLNATESRIATIWSAVLPPQTTVENTLSPSDNFFDLGGRSLLAMQVMAGIHDAFNIHLPLRCLFDEPTLEAFAAIIDQAPANHNAVDTQRNQEIEDDDADTALSHAQERFWFISRFEEAATSLNMVGAVRLSGPLDLPRLQRSVQWVVDRQPALRTVFHESDRKVSRHVLNTMKLTINFVDIRDGKGIQEDTENDVAGAFVKELIRREYATPFELGGTSNDPLIRLQLATLDPHNHVLLVSMHHMIADGRSIEIFRQQIAYYYSNVENLDSRDIPSYQDNAYSAFIKRQRLTREEFNRQWAYWQAELADIDPLHLWTDHSLPPRQTYHGASIDINLAQQSNAIKQLAKRWNISDYSFLLSMFFLLLSRFSTNKNICIGTPISGRRYTDEDELIGLYLNTITIRAELTGDRAMQTFATQVHAKVLDGLSHQDISFDQVIKLLQPERTLSHSPIFQVMFAYNEIDSTSDRMGDVRISPYPTEIHTAKYQLTLHITHDHGAFTGTLEYNRDLFGATTIQRMIDYYHHLISSILQHPTSHMKELPRYSDRQQSAWLASSRAEGAHPPGDTTFLTTSVYQLFEQKVRQAGVADKTALIDDGISILEGTVYRVSYGELNRRANRLAHRILASAPAPEAPIGVYAERSVCLIVALLAVFKAGRVFIPLNPELPEQRIRHIIGDAGIKLCISQETLQPLTTADEVEVVRLDGKGRVQAETQALIRDDDSKNPNLTIRPKQPAYIYYTSGSTGIPKGVICTHQGLLPGLYWYQNHVGITDQDTFLQKTPITFDVSLWEIFLPLISGATLVLAKPQGHRDPAYLAKTIERYQISVVHFVPSLLDVFIQQETIAASCKQVHTVMLSGEGCGRELVQRASTHFNAAFYNLYGPTEACVHNTSFKYVPNQTDDTASKYLPIGKAISGNALYILDDDLHPCPINVPGNLYIGGDCLALGYLNQPDLTSRVFVADTIRHEPGAIMYKTGDVAKYLPSGDIVYLSRVDQQVKIRGNRVEPGEIEHALLKHTDVSAAVVRVDEHEKRGPMLVAYVQTHLPAGEQTNQLLREHVKGILPDYMIPAIVIPLVEFPLNSNGKIKLSELPAPPALTTSSPTAPGGGERETLEEEHIMKTIWEQVLDCPSVGLTDNFFDLGGHSLLAIQVQLQVKQHFNKSIPIHVLFETGTLSDFTRFVMHYQEGDHASAVDVTITKAPDHVALPMSFAQQRLWFLDQLEPNMPTYNIPSLLSLTGDLDTKALIKAFNTLIERHEILRTVFVQESGQLVQQVKQDQTLSYEELDLPADHHDFLTTYKSELAGIIRTPFNLANGPLMKVYIIRISDKHHLLVLMLHHIIADGWSLGILIKEMSFLYNTYTHHRQQDLPPLPLQYGDYAYHQIRSESSDKMHAQLAYWKDYLQGAPPLLSLPLDKERPAIQSTVGASKTFAFGPALTEAIKETAKSENATPFMLLHSALALLLSFYGGQEDIPIGFTTANRSQKQLEDLIGFFVNVLVLRTDLRGEPTFSELLQQTKRDALLAYQHQDVSFDKIVEHLQPKRDTSFTPLVQVVFAFLNLPEESLIFDGLAVEYIEPEFSTSVYDMALTIYSADSGFKGKLEYRTDLFEPSTIEAMVKDFLNIVATGVENPGIKIWDILGQTPALQNTTTKNDATNVIEEFNF